MTTAKTLLRQIRNYCLNCCGDSRLDVENCKSQCACYPYRLGFADESILNKISTGKLLRVIKNRCLECASTPADVNKCTSGPDAAPYRTCELWVYRSGKDPKPAVRSQAQIEQSRLIGQKFRGNLIQNKEEVTAL